MINRNSARWMFASLLSAAALVSSFQWIPPARQAHGDEASPNLLKNASLDEPAEGADKNQPAHWKQGDPIDGVKYLWRKSTDSSKKGSFLAITKTANRYFPIASWSQVIEHQSDSPAIAISAKVRASKVTKAIIDAVFLDANGEWIEHKWVVYIGPKEDNGKPFNHDWKEYKGVVAIPEGCKKIEVSLQDYGPGTVMFDDIVAVYEKDVSKITDALSMAEPNSEPMDSNPLLASEPELNETPTLETPRESSVGAVGGMPPQEVVPGVSTIEIPTTRTIWVNGRPEVSVEPRTVYQTIDGKQFVDLAMANAHTETLKWITLYRQEKDAAAKTTIRESLSVAVSKEYDAIKASRMKEVEELQKKIEEVKANLAKRDELKDKIIERRVEQLLGVDPLYQWDSEDTMNGSPSMYNYAPNGTAPALRDPMYFPSPVLPQASTWNPAYSPPSGTLYDPNVKNNPVGSNMPGLPSPSSMFPNQQLSSPNHGFVPGAGWQEGTNLYYGVAPSVAPNASVELPVSPTAGNPTSSQDPVALQPQDSLNAPALQPQAVQKIPPQYDKIIQELEEQLQLLKDENEREMLKGKTDGLRQALPDNSPNSNLDSNLNSDSSPQ